MCRVHVHWWMQQTCLNAWFMLLMFDSSNSTRRKNCKIIVSPSKLHQNTSLYTAICLWKLYIEIFLDLSFSWLLIWNNAQESRIHSFHYECLSKRKLNITWGSELSFCNIWKQKFLHFSKVAMLLFSKGFSLHFPTLHHDLQWPHRVWMWKLLVVPVCS